MAWEISIYVDKYGKPAADPPPDVSWRWAGKMKKIATVRSRKEMIAVLKACKQRGFHGVVRHLLTAEQKQKNADYHLIRAQVRNPVNWREEMAFHKGTPRV